MTEEIKAEINSLDIIEKQIKAEMEDSQSNTTIAPNPDEKLSNAVAATAPQLPLSQEDLIALATKTAIEALQKKQEEVRMNERTSNPFFIAEDLIAAANIPDSQKDLSFELFQTAIEDLPKVDVETAHRIANSIVRKAEASHKIAEETRTHEVDQKFGSMLRKYGENFKEILDSMGDHYEEKGISKNVLKRHMESMSPSEFGKTVDDYYRGHYKAQAAVTPSKAEQVKMTQSVQSIRDFLDGKKH